jgi:hypothetical protein
VIAETEIESPEQVWAALSELWLEMELPPDDLQRIAAVMQRSGLNGTSLRKTDA